MKARYPVGVVMLATILLCMPGSLSLARNIERYQGVRVEIISDDRGQLPKYPAGYGGDAQRNYVEARDNERYRIRVANITGERIGLVIAVDGRNIISGAKSYLAPSERMYILNPFQSAEYEGWRTGRNRVNRFYFTGMSDSYAAAWGDYSAMGVIAVAAFREREQHLNAPRGEGDKIRPLNRPEARTQRESPGTGFGEGEWSPSRPVHFEPEGRPVSREFIKYEWYSTLCKRGVIDCRRQERHREGNRFWPEHDGGYAPYPPGRHYGR